METIKKLIKKYHIRKKINKLNKILREETNIINLHLQRRQWQMSYNWLQRRKKTINAIQKLKRYETNF